MAELKTRWLSLIDEYLTETTNTPVIDVPTEVSPPVVPIIPKADIAEKKTADVVTDDELPIYEATPAQINYWHSFSNNGFLQTMLSEYDLDYASANVAALNHFKIGLDKTRHVATFAIDDTHYYAIQFNEWNTEPLDRTQARRVLEKICALRVARHRFEDFCGYQVERFD